MFITFLFMCKRVKTFWSLQCPPLRIITNITPWLEPTKKTPHMCHLSLYLDVPSVVIRGMERSLLWSTPSLFIQGTGVFRLLRDLKSKSVSKTIGVSDSGSFVQFTIGYGFTLS